MVSEHTRPETSPAAAPRAGERGFTLIELSIVLIIIGLIIGGILQGQEMINNTRLKTQVSQFDAIQAAINTFEDKFNELPGDFQNGVAVLGAGAGTDGDGDGFIEPAASTNAGSAFGTTPAGEMFAALNHLNLARLIEGVQTITGGFALNGQLSNSRIDLATYTFGGLGDRLGVAVRGSAGPTTDVLRPSDAFSIDTKYDDGVANTGRYQASGNTVANCHASGAYTAQTTDTCYMVFSMR